MVWGWLKNLLQPNALKDAGVIPPFLDYEPGSAAANDQVRAILAQYEDDGTQPRHVVHHAYPTGEGARDKSAARRVIGWKMSQFSDARQDDGLMFEEIREIASPEFDVITDRFRVDLAAIGWKYDGWESAVIASEDEI